MASTEELDEQIQILGQALDVIVEMLEEKGIITTEEYQTKIKEKLSIHSS